MKLKPCDCLHLLLGNTVTNSPKTDAKMAHLHWHNYKNVSGLVLNIELRDMANMNHSGEIHEIHFISGRQDLQVRVVIRSFQ